MMKRVFTAIAALAFASLASQANATCFWVGGTGTWSTTNTASWASSTGGTGGTCSATGGVPKQSADNATFDGSSGGGVVTVDSSMSGATISTLTAGAFTGTLDFSVNNPTLTVSVGGVNLSGTGARKFLFGTSTIISNCTNCTSWTLQTTTNLDATSDFSSMTLVIGANTNPSGQTIYGGGKTYGTLQINATGRTGAGLVTIGDSGNTLTNLTIPGAGTAGTYVNLSLPSAGTMTITNAVNWPFSVSSPLYFGPIGPTSSTTVTFTNGGTISGTAFHGVTGAGTAITATNSINLGGSGGTITINNPSGGGGGGGGRVVGG